MKDKMMSVMIKLALCPDACDSHNPAEVCAICPHRGERDCASQLKAEAMKLLGDQTDVAAAASPKTTSLEGRITEVLHELGVPAHINGYKYLRCAILTAMENPGIMDAVTSELYPLIAREFQSTGSRVERGIRHAIEAAWYRGDLGVFQKWFGNTIVAERGKPTNSEFIAMVADTLRIEIKAGAR